MALDIPADVIDPEHSNIMIRGDDIDERLSWDDWMPCSHLPRFNPKLYI